MSGGSDSVSEAETVRKACSDSFSEAVRVSGKAVIVSARP